ncbi:unnamed protein product [marine sediment metagenome]|uniref:Uncharacterized protein n=1 Tax=marine sediment metagenome TaxID=412755 RepID=X1HY52_9ZZZZ
MERDIIKNEKDRIEFFRQISRALRPLRKALIEFKKAVGKIDWEEINKEMEKHS